MNDKQDSHELEADRLMATLGVDGLNCVIPWTDSLSPYGYDGCPMGITGVSFEPPAIHRTGHGVLADLGVGPGRITLIGGAPKVGKTTLVNQITLDALRTNSRLFALIANAETSRDQLVKRLIARLSGLPIEAMDPTGMGAEAKARLERGLAVLEELKEPDGGHRVHFLKPPFDLLNVLMSIYLSIRHDCYNLCNYIIVIDFIQCFKTVDRRELGPWRSRMIEVEQWEPKRKGETEPQSVPPPMTRDLGQIMDDLRAIARRGVAIVAVSRLNRQAYEEAAIGGFFGSGELEYQCDNAFIMTEEPDRPGVVRLREVANRHGETRDRLVRFVKHIHRFSGLEDGE